MGQTLEVHTQARSCIWQEKLDFSFTIENFQLPPSSRFRSASQSMARKLHEIQRVIVDSAAAVYKAVTELKLDRYNKEYAG